MGFFCLFLCLFVLLVQGVHGVSCHFMWHIQFCWHCSIYFQNEWVMMAVSERAAQLHWNRWVQCAAGEITWSFCLQLVHKYVRPPSSQAQLTVHEEEAAAHDSSLYHWEDVIIWKTCSDKLSFLATFRKPVRDLLMTRGIEKVYTDVLENGSLCCLPHFCLLCLCRVVTWILTWLWHVLLPVCLSAQQAAVVSEGCTKSKRFIPSYLKSI